MASRLGQIHTADDHLATPPFSPGGDGPTARGRALLQLRHEKFVLSHRCKKLFIIEVVGFQEEDEEVDEEIECAALTGALDAPTISLHAVTGVRARGVQTMKVFVSISDAWRWLCCTWDRRIISSTPRWHGARA
jgi:hypothetical protein